MSKRFNIGYLTAHKVISYPTGIQDGVQNGIIEQGHNLINISDLISFGFINTASDLLKITFELTARLNLDCVIVPAGVVNAYLAKKNILPVEDLIRLLDPARTIIIEDNIEGYRSIYKDNKPGMRELIRHLIEDHHYKNICFLSGPETSQGAREREGVYFEEMEAHGIPVRDHMFARGIFSGECDAVVEELLFFNEDVEAIVCANDIMAFTVYRILKEHGLTPGVDVAVTGFDDSPESQHSTPPLSTVRLSAYDLGYTAAYEAVRLCEGKEQQVHTLGSTFVHRISCGEKDAEDGIEYKKLLVREEISIEELTELMLSNIVKRSSEEIQNALRDRIQRIAEKLAKICDETAEPDFEHLIDAVTMTDVFRRDYANYMSFENFQTAISTCLEAARDMVFGKRREWIDHENAYFNRLMANNINDRYQQQQFDSSMRSWQVTNILADALMHADNPRLAAMQMINDFKELAISEAVILTFDEPVTFYNKINISMDDEVNVFARLTKGTVSVFQGRKVKKVRLQEIFSTFMPDQISEKEMLMAAPFYTIGPLVSGAEMNGAMLIGPSVLLSSEIQRLYYQTGFGVKHINTIQREKELISILNKNNLKLSVESEHDELTGLLNRRGFMRALERELMEEIQRDNAIKRGGLFFMDLDGLKQINDNYGHDEGDFAIKSTAQILSKAFEKELVARLGGDEFVAYKPLKAGESAKDMVGIIEEIMESFNERSYKDFALGISVGYSEFTITEDILEEVPGLLNEADELLYQNKRRRKKLKSRR